MSYIYTKHSFWKSK